MSETPQTQLGRACGSARIFLATAFVAALVCALLLAPAASAKPARPALTILTPLSGVTIADSVTVQARLNNVPGRRTFIYKIDG
jgi:hypothetical protein